MIGQKNNSQISTPSKNGLKLLTFSLFYILFFSAFNLFVGQEICNNGIDDDGDGLIDLNDVAECTCVPVVVSIPSLIPNPSFETTACNPTSYSQVNCAQGWVQATTATSDYFNTSFNFGAATANGLVPPPDGTGYIGTIFSNGWQEYVGSCLINPMLAGAAYSLNFNIASGYINGMGGNVGAGVPPPTTIVLYGNTNCNLPVNTTGCPTGINGWFVLGQATTSGTGGWQIMTINFTPGVNVNAIMVGSACGFVNTAAAGNYDYHYYDNLILNAQSAFTAINSAGTWCGNNLVITGPSSAGASYQWFKNGIAIVGQTDTLINLSANNFTPGDYTLVTYLGGNCSRADITIDPPVIIVPPVITAVAPMCAGAPVFNMTVNPNAGVWSGTGITNTTTGTFNPTIAGVGTHPVTFTQSGPCSGSTTYNVVINPNPVASFSSGPVGSLIPGGVCVGNNVAFTDQSTVAVPGVISNWAWTFSDGTTSAVQNPTHNFPNDGIYTNSLTVTTASGCVASISNNTTVWPNPVASFTTNNNCFEALSSFTNTSTISSANTPNTIASYTWDFGDALTSALISPTHMYGAPGTFNVQVTATSANGCVNSVTNPITIYSLPVAGFSAASVCLNTQSAFIDNSTMLAPAVITNWNWILGDGTTSAIQNPTHTFTTANTFPDTLIVTSNQGCKDTMISSNIVWSLPTADFTTLNVCAGFTTSFTDASTTIAPEVLNTWAWTFSDGATSNLQNPTHDFPNEGIYANTLLVTTVNGCTATVTHNTTVWPLPAPSFTAPNNCFATVSNFTNTSTISSINSPNTIATYAWDFGDALMSALTSPTHLYASQGTYNVQLTATSQNGCVNSVTNPIVIYSLPIADFNVAPECFGVGSSFIDASTIIAPDVITTWNWIFGDGSTSNIQNPTYLFAAENTYLDSLIITSNQGCKDTVAKINIVWPLPAVDFTVTDECWNFANVLTDQSIISNAHTTNSNVAWMWTLGDGNFAPIQNGTHVYNLDGTYSVQLMVTSNHGCQDSLTKTATVYPKPNAIISGVDLIGCSPICPSLSSVSTVNTPSTITNFHWVYSDGAIANGINSIRCLENTTDHTEYYDVTLYVETEMGCKDTVTNLNYIQVYHLPIADFTFSPNDPDIHRNRIEFTNNSLYASTYEWSFSDGQFSTLTNPEVILDEGPGYYTAELTAITQNGCTDTISKQIFIKDVVTFWVPNTFTPNGDGNNNTWKPIIYSGIDEFNAHIMIFNRWGEMIWESFDVNVGWDGDYGGTPVEVGTYTWKFEYKLRAIDERKTAVGHVNIIK